MYKLPDYVLIYIYWYVHFQSIFHPNWLYDLIDLRVWNGMNPTSHVGNGRGSTPWCCLSTVYIIPSIIGLALESSYF